jgi:predicted nucleic acid-binding protein
MRFVDASVFLYAYLKPRRVVSVEVAEVKKAAKGIVNRINAGERVATNLVHLSEVANILESSMPIPTSHLVMRDLIHSPSIHIIEPTREDYVDAVEVAEEASIGFNDGVAYVLMRENEIHEIYSFDKHFDRLKDTKRIRK